MPFHADDMCKAVSNVLLELSTLEQKPNKNTTTTHRERFDLFIFLSHTNDTSVCFHSSIFFVRIQNSVIFEWEINEPSISSLWMLLILCPNLYWWDQPVWYLFISVIFFCLLFELSILLFYISEKNDMTLFCVAPTESTYWSNQQRKKRIKRIQSTTVTGLFTISRRNIRCVSSFSFLKKLCPK